MNSLIALLISLSFLAPHGVLAATKFSKVIGWPKGKTPVAPKGYRVLKFAEDLKNPRWAYVMPNGDILIAEAESNKERSANRITLLRDADHNGKPELRTIFLKDLNQPLGMLVSNGYFYVANTDGVWRYPYKEGMTEMKDKGQKILDLPAGGYNNHWTRNLIASPDGKKIFVSVGSGSNVAEHGIGHEKRRANIIVTSPEGKDESVYASGLRNPVGMAFEPETRVLWTVVNERDGLGDNLVPDFLTHVEEGAFYGWPYVYDHTLDPRRKGERDELLGKTTQPDVLLGSHTASLGLTFIRGKELGEKYQEGAFIGQHGSWNSSKLVGYKVIFIPFKAGKPSGKEEDFLTGFIKDRSSAEVYGRPVGVIELKGQGLLVCDDAGDTLWLVEKM